MGPANASTFRFFLLMLRRPPRSTPFPTRRSSDLASESGRRGSNPRPSAWKADALPTELRPRAEWWGKDSNLRRLTPADLQSAPFGRSGTPPRQRLGSPPRALPSPVPAPSDNAPRVREARGELGVP